MKRTLATAPTDQPLTKGDLRQHARVDSREFDAELVDLLGEAIDAAEAFTWRRLCTQTWDYYLDTIPAVIRLPYPPASSITHVKYYDSGGTLQTVADTVYELGDDHGVGLVRLKHNQSWPSDFRGHADDLVVRFVCGYGGPSSVPGPIKRALRLYVATMFRDREAARVPDGFYRLLSPYESPDKLRKVYHGTDE